MNGDELVCYCPLHDDQNASLFINLEENLIHCFAGCVAGKFDKFVLDTFGGVNVNDIFDFGLMTAGSVVLPLRTEWVGTECSYLLQRGFTKQTIRRWGICHNKTEIAIPVYDYDSRYQGMIYRSLNGTQPKYYYSRGFKLVELFGVNHLQKNQSEIYIVEGALDCIWLHQCSFSNTLALLGLGTKTQRQRLLDFQRVFLCLDNDDEGIEATRRFGHFLTSQKRQTFVVSVPEDKKDIQEVSCLDINNVLSNCIEFYKWQSKPQTKSLIRGRHEVKRS